MDTVMSIWTWVSGNYVNVFLLLSGLVGVAEVATRFTKTEADDGFVKRFGGSLDKVMDFFKVPNRKK